MKITNTAGGSPMPNQRIAKGIHASGDSERKKFTAGKKALRAGSRRPSHSPSGTAVTVARVNPTLTRKSEATTSCARRPLDNSSLNPRATVIGDGKSDGGKSWSHVARLHSPSKMAATNQG